jgi:hypothetical protein
MRQVDEHTVFRHMGELRLEAVEIINMRPCMPGPSPTANGVIIQVFPRAFFFCVEEYFSMNK